jgi:hypothetical protein
MPGSSIFGVGLIRAAADNRMRLTSERSTAAEIGMSYTAFRSFMRGAKPQKETRARLLAWYTRQRGGRDETLKEDVEAAITLLVQNVAEASTPTLARRRVLSLLDALLEELGPDNQQVVIPALVETLLARSGALKNRSKTVK